jgi:riboflavin synthase
MFTGLVEACGTVVETSVEGSGRRIVIDAPIDLQDGNCRLGDSICLNGCCLTVIEIDRSHWAFQAGAETLSKTNLGTLTPGSPVNMERSLAANGRLGGHIVQGHVDGVGTVSRIDQDGEWTTMEFTVPADLAEMMVPKGSVTVDGVSLTVVTVARDGFTVALIPHTLAVTTLGRRRPGDAVNIEVDILGKYVRRFLAAWNPASQGT